MGPGGEGALAAFGLVGRLYGICRRTDHDDGGKQKTIIWEELLWMIRSEGAHGAGWLRLLNRVYASTE